MFLWFGCFLYFFNYISYIHERIKYVLFSHRFYCHSLAYSLWKPPNQKDHTFSLPTYAIRHTLHSSQRSVYCGLHCWGRGLRRSTYLKLIIREYFLYISVEQGLKSSHLLVQWWQEGVLWFLKTVLMRSYSVLIVTLRYKQT